MSKPDLSKMFEQYNRELFNNLVPEIPVVWNNRLRTSAGRCKFIVKGGKEYTVTKIEMANRIFANNDWDPQYVEETLLHEMTHAYLLHHFNYRGHGPLFQSTMDKVCKRKGSHTYHNYNVDGVAEDYKWELYCPKCDQVVAKRKRKRNELIHTVCKTKVTFRAIQSSDKRSISLI